jgi:digeranylgeranylglycerophospholipid reductase
VIDEMYGGIPAFRGHRFLRRANVLLVGDAARLVDSLTGAGIANALMSGDLAGRAAAAYARSGDPQHLDQYARQWRLHKARLMRLYSLAREIFLRLKESDLNFIIGRLGDHFEGRNVSHVDPVDVIKMIFRFHRPLLGLVRHLEW